MVEGGGGGLFRPYKSLGLVCDEVPLVTRRMPKKKLTVVFTAVGRVVHQYNAQSLRLISVSEPLPERVSALAADPRHVYAAHGPSVSALHLSRQVKYRYGSSNPASPPVVHLLPFGAHLITVDAQSRLQIWDIEGEELHSEFPPEESFSITTVCHPPTYLNKILIGSKQGPLGLLNVRRGAVVYTFGGFGSGVSAVEPSPAVDIVAVGTDAGTIHLHNIASDESLFKLRQDWGPVRALAFRTDGEGTLVSSGGKGNLAVWDLEERRLSAHMERLHRGHTVTGLAFILGEPIMLTNGGDNGLRCWIFDQPSGVGRQLAERCGHSAPVNTVKFHGSSGEMVISGSEDGSLREMSTWKDTKQQNLGTGGSMSATKAKKRGLPVEEVRYSGVVELVTGTAREAAWDNCVARHRDALVATAWTSRRHRLGAHSFLHNRFASDAQWRDAVCSAVEMTACGNFVLLGYTSGHVDMWNMQSGIHRGCFKAGGEAKEVKHRAHMGPVRGLATDALNQTIISGGGEGFVKVWRMRTKKERARFNVEESVWTLSLQRDSGLLALGCQTKFLIIDIHALRIVRHLHLGLEKPGPWRSTILSWDSSWALGLDGGGQIRVWDIPSGRLLDVLRFRQPASALALAPTGRFLATAHEGAKGVYLWTNRALFSPHYAMRPLPQDWEPSEASLPYSAPMAVAAGTNETEEVDLEAEEVEEPYADPDHLSGTISLSGQARPRWVHMAELDALKAAGKPKAPPKKPEAAPFFLPTTSGLRDFSFVTPADPQPPVGASKLVKRKMGSVRPKSAFARQLEGAVEPGDFIAAFHRLKALPPPAIDTEIRGLGAVSGGSGELLERGLRMLSTVLRSHTDWELAQAYLALFLKVHREEVLNDSGLEAALREVKLASEESWSELSAKFNACLATLAWTTQPTL